MISNVFQKHHSNDLIWQSDQYAIYRDKVVQANCVAQVISPTEITSNYESEGETNSNLNSKLWFKFSLNGEDNEMEYGKNHFINIVSKNGVCETPIIKFGQQYVEDQPNNKVDDLELFTAVKLRLDLREILEAFQKQGFYTTCNGQTIRKKDFKGVYVVGSLSPLSWNFENLDSRSDLKLQHLNNDGIYEITLPLNTAKEDKQHTHWQQTKDTSGYPQYNTDFTLAEAIYNLSLEEMVQAIETDGTFRTGKEWAGVWTRDVSYSIILAMAMVQPQVSRESLMRKVKNKKIVQDTGTGGAYPISTDRMIWAVAAWEIYKVIGDYNWLSQAYEIIKNSLEDDLLNIYDVPTGLVNGESSFLDWREQTYPHWMQPADIFESKCLGTNAVHFQANLVMAQMAEVMNDQINIEKYKRIAAYIKNGINKYLWLPQQGYYGQYLYGRNYKVVSPRAEALGEALCILFDVADAETQKNIVQNTPVTDFGITCIFPQIPDIPSYHNKGIWPFVQAYWALAAAKTHQEESLTESICAIYRATALFLTNKENFVSSTGDYAGTQVNSDNMLWSLAGNLSLVYKVIFGIEFQVNSLVLKPFVPKAFAGKHNLRQFKYRKAELDIEITGYGTTIGSILLDGKSLPAAEIPGDITGKHEVKIALANNMAVDSEINKIKDYESPAAPIVTLKGNLLSWPKVERALKYKVLENGQEVSLISQLNYQITAQSYAEYQIIAIDAANHESFASEPVVVASKKAVQLYKLTRESENDFVEISKKKNPVLFMSVFIPDSGTYAINFKYANGNGPIESENKCAFRTLRKAGAFVGTIVFPQRGTNAWSDWGFSNTITTNLQKGKNLLSLTLEPTNENMNGEINDARLDYIRIIKIK